MKTDTLFSYQDALTYLYDFMPRERRPTPATQVPHPNLLRIGTLLAALNNPHQHLRCILVAGTNGKGSTCAMLESIVRAAGYRTGLWTSPHLTSYRERIRVNNQMISEEELANQVAQIYPVVETFDTALFGRPSTFDLGFAIALRFFVAQWVQVAIVEVGIGGRYDCTNIITPAISVISSISYDHMDILGTTLTDIASDKAGILKPGVPGITIPQDAEAAAAMERVACEVGAPLWIAAPDGLHRSTRLSYRGTSDSIPRPYPTEPASPMRGAFQRDNARLAVGAAMLLHTQGYDINTHAIHHGLAQASLAGRLEVVRQSPTIVLDGAHNGDAARHLAVALQTLWNYNRLLLILGVSRDKQVEAILHALVPYAHTVILTRSTYIRACHDLDELAYKARAYTQAHVIQSASVADALSQAIALAHTDDILCVTGSLMVVGEARMVLGQAEACDISIAGCAV